MNMISLNRLFRLDHESLSKQGPFWLSILIPLVISILLCIPLWIHTTIDLSPDGYGKFLDMYKLPIGILSLSIPLVAIVAHIHRTIQTSEQIKSARDKSKSDSFFSHHKFVIDAFSKIPPKIIDSYEYKIEDPYSIYAYLFEDASYTNGVNIENLARVKQEFTDVLISISTSIESVSNDKNRGSRIYEIYNITSEIFKLESMLSITKTNRTWHSLMMDKDELHIRKVIIPFHNESELKKRLATSIYFIRKTLQIVNINIDISDVLDFYTHIDKSGHQVFSLEFKNSIKTTELYSISFVNIESKSSSLIKEYDEYMIELNRQQQKPNIFINITK
ncbi:Uncharacterised protein [Yersinia bercovieri]|uniref:hypothetical protein n=1 Tax=Yersinia bercovieri TaxID=634 RepID=UPI00061BE979|nr:hypothetical protein [Yersinia bercovieri]CNF35126.1 Uncharacterised protein [Yersinia bercovieri]